MTGWIVAGVLALPAYIGIRFIMQTNLPDELWKAIQKICKKN